jgi:selenocysteine lyase/cysteine desulfurase
METNFAELVDAEFALEPGITYLNTASLGIGPQRAAAALHHGADAWTSGRSTFAEAEAAVDSVRRAYARLTNVPPDRVAVGSTVSAHVGLIAAALPEGAEVLIADDDFASLVTPFATRRDVKLRSVPLERLADAVRPGTDLVAVSAVQSVDGRTADLTALRYAAEAAGARVLLDATQAAGWLPLQADGFDYVVCGAYKWLLCPRGVSLLTVREGSEDGISPHFAGWYNADDIWADLYGPIPEGSLASSARRFDSAPAYLPYLGAARSLALVEELGVDAIRAHDVALAERFHAGLASLGLDAPSRGSAIVAVPGLGRLAAPLADAGIFVATRGGHLRAAFHLYNGTADVDRLLDAVAGRL